MVLDVLHRLLYLPFRCYRKKEGQENQNFVYYRKALEQERRDTKWPTSISFFCTPRGPGGKGQPRQERLGVKEVLTGLLGTTTAATSDIRHYKFEPIRHPIPSFFFSLFLSSFISTFIQVSSHPITYTHIMKISLILSALAATLLVVHAAPVPSHHTDTLNHIDAKPQALQHRPDAKAQGLQHRPHVKTEKHDEQRGIKKRHSNDADEEDKDNADEEDTDNADEEDTDSADEEDTDNADEEDTDDADKESNEDGETDLKKRLFLL